MSDIIDVPSEDKNWLIKIGQIKEDNKSKTAKKDED